MPLVDIDQSLMSEACYQTKEAAWKSASKKHGFIKVLVKYCQDEYMASTENVSALSNCVMTIRHSDGVWVNVDGNICHPWRATREAQ